MTGLSVRGVTVLLGKRTALEDVSFTAPAGALTAVLGDAGAGKTTLLAAIAGLLKLERGAVLRDGADLARVRPAQRSVALLSPGESLSPDARLGAALHRLAGRAGRAECEALVDQLGLARLADSKVADLTHGEGLLALTAARLARATATILVDEAGAGLAPEACARLQDVLRYHAQAGRTVVFTTRQPEMAWCADHLVLLACGRVLQAGAPASVHDEPRDVASVHLTGPASILTGHVREVRAGGFVWSAGGARFAQAAGADAPRPTLGSPLTLCLRPEWVRVLGAAETADNVLDGIVSGVRAWGGHWLVQANTQVGAVLACAGRGWASGQAIRLGWDSSAGYVLT